MKIFRVHQTDPSGESKGYEYFSNRKDADKAQRENAKKYDHMAIDPDAIDEREVVIGKVEFLKLLNEWGSHPDNG